MISALEEPSLEIRKYRLLKLHLELLPLRLTRVNFRRAAAPLGEVLTDGCFGKGAALTLAIHGREFVDDLSSVLTRGETIS